MGFKLVYFMRKHECARWSDGGGGASTIDAPTLPTPTRSRFRCVKTRSGAAKRDCTTHVAADTPPPCIYYSPRFPLSRVIYMKYFTLPFTFLVGAVAEYTKQISYIIVILL